MQNPLLTNQLIERNTVVDRIVATGSANLDLLGMFGVKSKNHSLSYNLNLSYSRTYAKDFTFIPAFIISETNYLAKSNETLSQGYRSYTDGLIENFVTYDGKMGKHHLNMVAGHTFQRESYHTLAAKGVSMPEPYYLQINNGETRDANSYESEHVLTSYIGRINYDYAEKYLFQATVRRDGSSRLSNDGRWGWFPSASVGWRIDKESFFNVDPQLVSLLKLRASYGVLGNENIGDYQFMATMARGNYTYSFNGNKVTGSAISDYVNTAIKWEKKKTLDVGLDYAMFGGKLEFNADWYKAVSEDLLYSVPVPAEAGATNGSVTMNAATMVNSGLEFALSWHDYGHELKYDISANVTLPKNKVTSLGMGESTRIDGNCITTVGDEVGKWYGYVYEGIFQSQDQIDNRVNDEGLHVNQNGAQPGDVAYKDVNNDGEITADDRTVLGSGMSKFQFGLSFRLEYKGFDLNVSTFGAAGYQVADFVDMALRSSYSITNKSVDLLNAWTPENPSTTVPRVYWASTGSITNDMFSSRYLQNGAYWKISNVELGYHLPDKWFNNVITGVRVYVSGQNLATISKYRGYNIDFAGGTFTPGYNYCSYPTPMTMMFGVNLSF
jgi:TonB-linked SusC/RagA family outer membrane protein